jgi:hypothetical protein
MAQARAEAAGADRGSTGHARPATTPPERIWIMPKTTKSKPAKSQKTDPAAVAAKKAAKAAKKQRSAEPKVKTPRTSKPATDGTVRKHRDGTKQAKLIEMLRRPEGATIAQIVAATKGQQHTVRGAISSALKKKPGLAVTSEKIDGGDRVYRIVNGD